MPATRRKPDTTDATQHYSLLVRPGTPDQRVLRVLPLRKGASLEALSDRARQLGAHALLGPIVHDDRAFNAQAQVVAL